MMELVVVTWKDHPNFTGDFPFLQTENENKGYGRYIKTKYYIGSIKTIARLMK